jgi:hypothetical protein
LLARELGRGPGCCVRVDGQSKNHASDEQT